MLKKVSKYLAVNEVSCPKIKDREELRKLIDEGWETYSDPLEYGYGEELDQDIKQKDAYFAVSQEEYELYLSEASEVLIKSVDAFICDVNIEETTREDCEAILFKMREGYVLTAYEGRWFMFKPEFYRSDEDTKKMLEKVYLEFYNYDVTKYTTFEYMDNFVKSLNNSSAIPACDFYDLTDVIAALVDLPKLLFGRTTVWTVEGGNDSIQGRFGFILDGDMLRVVSYAEVVDADSVFGEDGPI